MPGAGASEADLPRRLWQVTLEETDARQAQSAARRGHQTQARAGPHEEERGEELIGLLDDGRGIAGLAAGGEHMIVKGGRGGARDEDEGLLKEEGGSEAAGAGEILGTCDLQFVAEDRRDMKIGDGDADAEEADVEVALA